MGLELSFMVIIELFRLRLTNDTTRGPSFSGLRDGLRRLTGGQLLIGGLGGSISFGVLFSFLVENVTESVMNCGLGRGSEFGERLRLFVLLKNTALLRFCSSKSILFYYCGKFSSNILFYHIVVNLILIIRVLFFSVCLHELQVLKLLIIKDNFLFYYYVSIINLYNLSNINIFLFCFLFIFKFLSLIFYFLYFPSGFAVRVRVSNFCYVKHNFSLICLLCDGG